MASSVHEQCATNDKAVEAVQIHESPTIIASVVKKRVSRAHLGIQITYTTKMFPLGSFFETYCSYKASFSTILEFSLGAIMMLLNLVRNLIVKILSEIDPQVKRLTILHRIRIYCHLAFQSTNARCTTSARRRGLHSTEQFILQEFSLELEKANILRTLHTVVGEREYIF